MSSLKTMFCDLCVILVFGLSIIFAEEQNSTVSVLKADLTPTGNCSCGGFASVTPAPNTAPLLSQAPGLVVKCDDEGANTCKDLCNALAIATKAKGPEILCSKLGQANELKLSAFSKICDRPWSYANITSDNSLCCEEGKVKMCPSAANLNVTTVM